MKTSSADEELAAGIVKEFQQLSSSRGNWESHWTEIAQRVDPASSYLFQNFGQGTKGEKRTFELYDSTAAIGLDRFASILDSLLTPRNSTWHRMTTSDPYLMKDRQTRLWFDEANRILFKHRYAPTANFPSQNQQNFRALGAYGTGCVYIDKLDSGPIYGKGLRYKNIHLGEVYLKENHQGIVDGAIRHFALTARQAFQKFGEELPEAIIEASKNSPDREYFFLHCVKPREDRDPFRVDYKGMPFASYHISMDGKKKVSEGGYTTFPYACSRYVQSPNEIYGRSPAMMVLPAIKTLNEEKKIMLKQGHRTVDPVLLAYDDGVLDGFSLKPGSMNAGGVSADGKALVHALPVGNIAVGKDLMDDERAVINDAFLTTIFQILTENPQMTATEVVERAREKGILLAPTLGRQESEYLGSLINREIDVLSSEGMLPPMPQALREASGEYQIVFDSPLSRMQRAEEASGLMRTVESALQIVNVTQNPEPLDFFDWDVIIPEVSDIQGVPAKWMKSMDQVMAVRQGRTQQQQNQELIQAAPGAAAMLKANAVAAKGS